MKYFLRFFAFLVATAAFAQTTPIRNPQIQGTAGQVAAGATLGNAGTINGAGTFDLSAGTVSLPASLAAGPDPVLTASGDASGSATFTNLGNATLGLTLATVNGNVGSFGSATAAPTFTVNGKGLLTAAGSVTITPAWASITSKPTTAAGFSITNGAAIDALGAVATNGGLYRTAANTYAARTITGTAGQITVTNGDGVAGAPTISLPATITQATTFSAPTLGLLPGANAATLSIGSPNASTSAALVFTTAAGSAASPINQDIEWRNYASTPSGRIRMQDRSSNFARTIFDFQTTPTGGTVASTFTIDGGGSAGNGIVTVVPTTASSSTTTGALVVNGGVGVAGAGYLGGNLTFGTSSSVLNGTTGSIGLTATGSNQSVSVTPTGTGMVLTKNLHNRATDAATIANFIRTYTASGYPAVSRFIADYTGTHPTTDYGPMVTLEVSDNLGTSVPLIGFKARTDGAANTGNLILDYWNAGVQTEILRTKGTSLLLGTTTDNANGRVQFASHTNKAGGIGFHSDTALHRAAAGELTLSRPVGSAKFHLIDESQPTYNAWISGAYSDNALSLGVNATTLIRSAGFATPTRVEIVPTTASTSTTTGALTVAGGVGVGGSLHSFYQLTSGNIANTTGWASQDMGTTGSQIFQFTDSTAATRLIRFLSDANRENARIDFVKTAAETTRNAYIDFVPYSANIALTGALRVHGPNATVSTVFTTEATAAGAGSVTTAGGIYAAKRVVTATSFVHGVQTFSGAGAASSTTGVSAITSSGAAQAISLADGVEGQVKIIVHKSDGGSIVITPTTKTGFSSVTLEDAGESVTMVFLTTAGWCITGNNGATITP